MTKNAVIEMATKAAKCCDIRLTRTDLILKKMRGQFPVTTIVQNENYILWIDRHYMAVGANEPNSFLYIYVAMHHVSEELREVVKLREKTESQDDYEFYSLIIGQLLNAQKNINENGCGYFLLENYLQQIEEMSL